MTADRAGATGVIRNELRRRGITAVPRRARPERCQEVQGQLWRSLSRHRRPPWTERDRAVPRPGHSMARYRHSLRQARDHLPRWHNSLRHPHLGAAIGRHALVSAPATPAPAPPSTTWRSATGGHSYACSDPEAAAVAATVITRCQSTCDGGETRRSLGSCTQ